MTKKTFLIFGLFLLGSLSSFAQEWAEQAKNELTPSNQLVQTSFYAQSAERSLLFEEVDLQVRIYDPTSPNKPIKRSPVLVPSLSLSDHTLYFNTSCDGCTLQLINEDGDIEYGIIIPENTSTITLPFYLSGEYELQIIRGNYCFYGYIEL